MHLKKAHVLIVLLWKLVCFEADGEKACSCYTFESKNSMTWRQARASCKYNKKDLVVMETEREWQFIVNELKNRTTTKNEWHIGLFWSTAVSNWTWVNGKPLTIKKWRDSEPIRKSYYALIAKEWPRGSYGKFDSIRGDIKRAWICEEETDTCQGVCMQHNPAVTTIATPRVTATTKERTSFNLADPTYFSSDVTTLARTSSLSERKTAKKDSSTVVIVAASLGTALFVALFALAVLVLLKRRRRHSSKDSEKPKKNALSQPENPYEYIDSVEAAKLLGAPNTGNVSFIKTEQVEYDMVNKKEDTKEKKGDVLYTQLDIPESDDPENNIKVRKPAPYVPTVYADVTPTGVINKAEPNSKLPTYANVQKTTVGV